MNTIVKKEISVESAAIRAWAEGRWEDIDEDITVPGIVAGNFELS